MNDGTGTLDYEYDELSRLKKEIKTFADEFTHSPPSGGYFLKYDYHLSGGLKVIEDPFGQKTTYAADRTGRMTSIGDQSSSTRYVSAISYRAFGGIKSLTMSTTAQTTLNMAYDNALRPAAYTAANTTAGTIQSAEYEYNNDGLVQGIDNTAEPEYDQTSKYDFAGRVTYNSAGPLVQQLEYDAFSNLTVRQNNFWSFMDRFQAWYTNNRKVSSTSPFNDTFDVSGNVVESLFDPYTPNGDRDYKDSKWWTFDAAGRVTYFSQYTTYTPSQDAREAKHDTTFDGDGRAVIDYERWRQCGTADDPGECNGTWTGMPFHYLVSSVTGQRITVLYDGENGGQTVHMGGTKIASYIPPLGEAPEYRSFTISDPVTGSTALIEADGTAHLSDRTELAALGTSVPLFEPPAFPGWENLENGFVGDAEHGCRDELGDPEPCSVSRVRDRSMGVKRPRGFGKRPISLIATRHETGRPWAWTAKGPPSGLSLTHSSSLEEPAPEDPCPWDTDGTKDCSLTVNDEGWTDPIMDLFDMKGGTVNDELSLSTHPIRPWFTPLDDGLAAAREALANPDCAALFTTMGASTLKTPLEMLSTYVSNGLIRVGSANADGENFRGPGTGASTSFARGSFINSAGSRESASVITINQSGFFFSGLIDGGVKVQSVKGGGFEGLAMSSVRGAVIIHELLHAAGAIPSDNLRALNDNGAQSMANAELVRKNCFGN